MTAFVLPAHMIRQRKPSSKPRQTPERDLQKSVAAWLRKNAAFPWTAIAHGVPLKKIKTKDGRWISPQGKALKDTGLNAGWPDIHFIHNRRPCYIELKSAKGVLSEDQRRVRTEITAAGGVVATCRSLEEVIEHLRTLQVPLKDAFPTVMTVEEYRALGLP